VRAALWVKEDHVILAAAWDMVVQDVLAESAMGINGGDAGAGVEVGGGHIHKQGALPGSRAAEERHVLPARLGWHAEIRLAEEIICMGADGCGVEHGGWSLNFTGVGRIWQFFHDSLLHRE
jgi:hypothetical protein